MGINEVKIWEKGSQMNLGNAILQMEDLKLAYRKQFSQEKMKISCENFSFFFTS